MPRGGTAVENGNVGAAAFDKPCNHTGSLASLADQYDRDSGEEVVEAGLNLLHGDVDGAGNVTRSIFAGGTDVDPLKFPKSTSVRTEFGSCDRVHWPKMPSIYEERGFWEKDSASEKILTFDAVGKGWE